MTVLISSGLLLVEQPPELDPGNGVILPASVVTIDDIEASSEDDDHPLSNVTNNSTNLEWRASSTAAQTITITIPEDYTGPIDGIGIAGSNFSSAGITLTIDARDNSEDDESWVELTYPLLRADDGPLLYRGERRSWREIRFSLSEGTEPARMSVLYVGPLTVLNYGINADHTPIVDGRVVREKIGRAVAGANLGKITISEHVETSYTINNMSEDWYRQNIRPIMWAREPMFLAWRPLVYPNEVGFLWLPADHNPRPVTSLEFGTVSLTFDVEGIV